MYKYTDPTALATGEMTDGDPLNGVPPTILRAVWTNMVQRELLNTLILAGITPKQDEFNQVAQAIAQLDAQVLSAAKSYADGKFDVNAQRLLTALSALSGKNVVGFVGNYASLPPSTPANSAFFNLQDKRVYVYTDGAYPDEGAGIAVYSAFSDALDAINNALDEKAAKTASHNELGGLKVRFEAGVLYIRNDNQDA